MIVYLVVLLFCNQGDRVRGLTTDQVACWPSSKAVPCKGSSVGANPIQASIVLLVKWSSRLVEAEKFQVRVLNGTHTTRNSPIGRGNRFKPCQVVVQIHLPGHSFSPAVEACVSKAY